MKKFYEDLEVEVIAFSSEDVITTSGEQPIDNPGIGENFESGDGEYGDL